MTAVSPMNNFPPVVYVPCQQAPATSDDIHDGSGSDVVVDTRQTKEGKTALLVYSAMDRLIDCCGDQQPWVVMPTKNLDKVNDSVGLDMILLDINIPEEKRRKGA